MEKCHWCGEEAKYQFKNGKWCCSDNVKRCPFFRRKVSEDTKNFKGPRNYRTGICRYCAKEFKMLGLKLHEKACDMNPNHQKFCPVCGGQMKGDKYYNETCSYSCTNKLKPRGAAIINNWKQKYKNGNHKSNNYRTICYWYHKKKCVICGEENIVAAHHLDENPNNNKPENLIPLCMTHHVYWHSKKFKHLIENKVMDYIKDWKLKNEGVVT